MSHRPAPAALFLAAAICSSAAAASCVAGDVPARAPVEPGSYLPRSAPAFAGALDSRSAVLIEASTGVVLYEKDPDRAIAPASLAKLMTMHIALSEIEAGRLSRDEEVRVPEAADYDNIARKSTLMLLSGRSDVRVEELLLGMAVVSANDAAVAIALRISGTMEAFAARMDAEARALGLPAMSFKESAGLNPDSRITAGAFAKFCASYISLHPYALERYNAARELRFPPGSPPRRNVNKLLLQVPGADGLKTGYLVETGFHEALTAMRGGMRLIAVTLSGPSPGEYTWKGPADEPDAARLLEFGFGNFRLVRLDPPDPGEIPGKDGRNLKVYAEGPGCVVLPSGSEGELSYRFELLPAASYATPGDPAAGVMVVSLDGDVVARRALRAREG